MVPFNIISPTPCILIIRLHKFVNVDMHYSVYRLLLAVVVCCLVCVCHAIPMRHGDGEYFIIPACVSASLLPILSSYFIIPACVSASLLPSLSSYFIIPACVSASLLPSLSSYFIIPACVSASLLPSLSSYFIIPVQVLINLCHF